MANNILYGECPTCKELTQCETGILEGENQPIASGNQVVFSEPNLSKLSSCVVRLSRLCDKCKGVLIAKFTELEYKGFCVETPEFFEYSLGTVFKHI